MSAAHATVNIDLLGLFGTVTSHTAEIAAVREVATSAAKDLRKLIFWMMCTGITSALSLLSVVLTLVVHLASQHAGVIKELIP